MNKLFTIWLNALQYNETEIKDDDDGIKNFFENSCPCFSIFVNIAIITIFWNSNIILLTTIIPIKKIHKWNYRFKKYITDMEC